MKRSIKQISWSKESKLAFDNLKKELNEKTRRAQPDFTNEFIPTTDASDFALGAILSQKKPNGTEEMIYAFSKTLDSAQRNYSVTDKELASGCQIDRALSSLLTWEEILARDGSQSDHLSCGKQVIRQPGC